jgi:putative protease
VDLEGDKTGGQAMGGTGHGGAAAALAGGVRLPELLAPAGDWECARAAVENGADAIYFGLDRFNARMRARNFTESDLPGLMDFLHRRGVRGYVTFNTLVFADELGSAAGYLRSIIAAGVDAAIVQDVGVCRLIRRLSPDFPIHGSTQMTVTSPAGVDLARDLGCNLVVLARENSIREIEAIQAAQRASGRASLPLEVFVHGALCVAYSGQCLTSESLGGRSANRGECAQACRMPYELVSDGRVVELGERRYLLSPQDLAGLDVLPQLVRAGVASLKIEGRLKSPEYVAAVTRVYRRALDGIAARPDAPTAAGLPGLDVGRSRYELEMGFSRGLHTGWFGGINNQELVHARFGKKRGVYLGEVLRVERERILLRPLAPVQAGDGVVLDAGRPDLEEEGGRIFGVHEHGDGTVSLAFGRGALDWRRVAPGQRLWKTGDPALERELRRTFEGEAVRRTRRVWMEVHGHEGVPLTVLMRHEAGPVVRAESSEPLAKAERQPLSMERLSGQLGRLGGTPFHLAGVDNRLEGDVILPVSELNRIRRDLVESMGTALSGATRWTLTGASDDEALTRVVVPGGAADAGVAGKDAASGLIVLVRSLGQLDAALGCGVRTVYCEFEDPKKLREGVRMARERCACAGSPVEAWVAAPRIFKPGEDWILKIVMSADPDGFLVRNAEHVRAFAGRRMRGDFSLNVANPLSAEHWIRGVGLERVTASYDLNVTQLEGLARGVPPSWLEVTIHQHMPMFHMEHCVFCAFLSKGTDYTNCGRPCDRHEVRLRDRVGQEHPLKADAGCRNTVFNGRAQTGAEAVGRMLALGLRDFRVEFVDEDPATVARTLGRYRALLRGEVGAEEVWRELKLHSQLGVTRGQLEREEARKVFPKSP